MGFEGLTMNCVESHGGGDSLYFDSLAIPPVGGTRSWCCLSNSLSLWNSAIFVATNIQVRASIKNHGCSRARRKLARSQARLNNVRPRSICGRLRNLSRSFILHRA